MRPVVGSICFLLEHKAFALVPAPGLFVLAHAAQPDFIRQLLPREGEQLPPETVALILRRHEQLVEIAVAADASPASPRAFRCRRRRKGSSRSRSPCGTRARKFASRELLASSASPVETQLSIQTRAISSYSCGRAGRMMAAASIGCLVRPADFRDGDFACAAAHRAGGEAHHFGDLLQLPRPAGWSCARPCRWFATVADS